MGEQEGRSEVSIEESSEENASSNAPSKSLTATTQDLLPSPSFLPPEITITALKGVQQPISFSQSSHHRRNVTGETELSLSPPCSPLGESETLGKALSRRPSVEFSLHQLARSRGSLELIDLNAGPEQIVVQLGAAAESVGIANGSGRQSRAASKDTTSPNDEDDVPEGMWRDGLFGCFNNLLPTCILSLCCTSWYQLSMLMALEWSSTVRTFTIMAVAGLWATVAVTLYLRFYAVAVAAFLMMMTLESTVAYKVRRALRKRYQIDQDNNGKCYDCLLSTILTSCVTAQMMRHLHHFRRQCECSY